MRNHLNKNNQNNSFSKRTRLSSSTNKNQKKFNSAQYKNKGDEYKSVNARRTSANKDGDFDKNFSKSNLSNFNSGRRNSSTNSYKTKTGKDNFKRKDDNNYSNQKNNRYHDNSFRENKSGVSNQNIDTYRQPRQYNNQLIEVPDDLIWGRHPTSAAFETGRPIHRVWCTSDVKSSSKFLQYLREAKASGVLVEEVSWARLAQLTKGAVHQGIVLQTAAAETLDLSKLIEACGGIKESPLLLALDGLTDPHNLGAIIRSAEALGAHGLVLPQRRSAGLTGSVAKVAAGALEHLPVARVVNLNRALDQLKKNGYSVIGLAEEGEFTPQEVDLAGPLVLVVGSEDKGISLLTRKNCDQLVRIPLRGITTSLNASIATSILLYEIARSSWMKSISGQSPSPKLVKAKLT